MATPRLTVGCPHCGAMVPHETVLSAERIGWRHACTGCGAVVALEALRVAASLAEDDSDMPASQAPDPAPAR